MVSKTPKDPKPEGKKNSKKATPAPLTSPTPELSGIPIIVSKDLSESEQKKIQEMIALAQAEYANVKSRVVRERKREIETLDAQIKEFMGPYILLGYDINNNPVEVISATNAAEHDALLERFRRMMLKINQNIANSNGTDPYGLNS